jgi:hypothetical protein
MDDAKHFGMKSRNAWFWTFTAATMLLVLVVYERLFYKPPPGPELLLPGFSAAAVDSIRVLPAGADEIQVVRSGGVWRLVRPLEYPAQARSIEALLAALEQLVPATKIPGAQLYQNPGRAAAYGLDPPRASLILSRAESRQQVLIGSLTPPGDQVFVQVVGGEGVSVVDAALLKWIPETANAWRDTALFKLGADAFDSVLVTAGERVIELKRDRAGPSWQIVRPMQARADAVRLENMIQALTDLRVLEFVSDDPRADRGVWGLQPPPLQLAFAEGTNGVRTLQFGDLVPGTTNVFYAVGLNPSAVVTVGADLLQGWLATPNDFRDRQLLRIPFGVKVVELRNGESFSLVNTTNGTWRIEPVGMPADGVTVQRFFQDLEALRVARFVKDVVAEPDLPQYGLATPAFHVALQFPSGGTSSSNPVVGLDFGSTVDEDVFVRRIDENAVYAVEASVLARIPAAAGHFRQLALWNFEADQVASVSLQKGSGVWRILQNESKQWSLAPGSQGILNAFAVDEVIQRLGQLRAVAWTDWNPESLSRYGVEEESVVLSVELKDGSRKSLRLGFPAPSGHVYAAVVLEGDPWVFELPRDAFELLDAFLIKPSNLR